MQLLLLLTIFAVSTCAIIRKPVNHSDVSSVKNEIDREIMEALKSIDETKKTIGNTVQLEKLPENSIQSEIGGFLSSMINAVRDVHLPFMTRSAGGNETSTPVTDSSNSSRVHDLMQNTREMMKKDVESLREYYNDIRVEFDEWIISNKHQNFKSMLIGVTTAIFVLFVYWIVVKCCLRRSRGHLMSFANDGNATKNGDNQWLLAEDPLEM